MRLQISLIKTQVFKSVDGGLALDNRFLSKSFQNQDYKPEIYCDLIDGVRWICKKLTRSKEHHRNWINTG